MWSYSLKRAATTAVTLLAASVIIFAFIHIVPGDPIYVLLGDTATPDQIDALRHQLGLDQPIILQYLTWIGHVTEGNLGRSIFFQAPVLSVIADGAETSALLATMTMIWVTLIGVPIGTYFLNVLYPVTTRWIISGFVAALMALLLSGWRYRGKDHVWLSVGIGGLSGFCSGLAQTGGPPIVGYWLGRPIAPLVARANILLFFGASDCFSMVSYATTGLISRESLVLSVIVGPVYALGVAFGASLFGRASETVFRRICYALIAIAVITGLPVLDRVLR